MILWAARLHALHLPMSALVIILITVLGIAEMLIVLALTFLFEAI